MAIIFSNLSARVSKNNKKFILFKKAIFSILKIDPMQFHSKISEFYKWPLFFPTLVHTGLRKLKKKISKLPPLKIAIFSISKIDPMQ